MYPTQKEILAQKPNISQKIIEATLSWKKYCLKGWKTKTKKHKLLSLEVLIWTIIIKYCSQNPKEKKQYLHIKNSSQYAYNQKTKTIYQDKNNPSIISALHELGHHLFGSSELTTCRWSYWLFATCFPGLLKKLTFKGHLLIKKEQK